MRSWYYLHCRTGTIGLLLILCLHLPGCTAPDGEPDLSAYQYRDTRNLVRFVNDARTRLERDGLPALDTYRKAYAGEHQPEYFLYVYDMHARNIYHAGLSSLAGRSMGDIRDINGKNIAAMVLEAINDPDNPHGWVHYSWWTPGQFYPVPKSSSNMRCTTPDGCEFYVGAGMDFPHEEKEFIRILVDRSVRKIEREGPSALTGLNNPEGSFTYREVHVFAFRPDGEVVISPVTQNSFQQMALLKCTDVTGHYPFASAAKRLSEKDRVWEVITVMNRSSRQPIKKGMYLRKTELAGKPLYVGAITDLPQPP